MYPARKISFKFTTLLLALTSLLLYFYIPFPRSNISEETVDLETTASRASPVVDLSHLYQSNSSKISTGTIYMKSGPTIILPISFTFLGGCSVLVDDFLHLTLDVGNSLIYSHREDSEQWPPFEQFQESVSIVIKDVEFRQSIDLLVDGKMNDTDFTGLVGLLMATIRRLFEANENVGFKYTILSGSYNGLAFKSWWTWYSIHRGVSETCKDLSIDQHIEL